MFLSSPIMRIVLTSSSPPPLLPLLVDLPLFPPVTFPPDLTTFLCIVFRSARLLSLLLANICPYLRVLMVMFWIWRAGEMLTSITVTDSLLRRWVRASGAKVSCNNRVSLQLRNGGRCCAPGALAIDRKHSFKPKRLLLISLDSFRSFTVDCLLSR